MKNVPENPAELSYKQLQEILRKGQDFMDFIQDQDPIVERQSKVTSVIEESLKCYREEATEKAKKVVKQTKLDNFFTKAGPSSSKSSQKTSESGQTSGKKSKKMSLINLDEAFESSSDEN